MLPFICMIWLVTNRYDLPAPDPAITNMLRFGTWLSRLIGSFLSLTMEVPATLLLSDRMILSSSTVSHQSGTGHSAVALLCEYSRRSWAVEKRWDPYCLAGDISSPGASFLRKTTSAITMAAAAEISNGTPPKKTPRGRRDAAHAMNATTSSGASMPLEPSMTFWTVRFTIQKAAVPSTTAPIAFVMSTLGNFMNYLLTLLLRARECVAGRFCLPIWWRFAFRSAASRILTARMTSCEPICLVRP